LCLGIQGRVMLTRHGGLPLAAAVTRPIAAGLQSAEPANPIVRRMGETHHSHPLRMTWGAAAQAHGRREG
jgi:hypothetical protein